MSHPYNFATYILRRVTIVYPFIGNYSRSIRYCIKSGIFSGPGAWRFFFFPHHGNRLWRRLGLRPRFFVTDAKALCKACGGSLRSADVVALEVRYLGAVVASRGFLPTQAQTISQAIGWLPFSSLTNTATRTSPLSCCRICSICPASSVAMAVRSPGRA